MHINVNSYEHFRVISVVALSCKNNGCLLKEKYMMSFNP